MKESKTLSRREFTVASALAVLSGVAITVTACGGGSSMPSSPSAPGPSPAPPPASGDKVGTVSANHGHEAVIAAARLTAAAALSLDIRGMADHTHTVQLSAADVMAIAGNQRVSRPSTNDLGHAHTVTFN